MMRTEEARPVRLADYRPPDWLVETVRSRRHARSRPRARCAPRSSSSPIRRPARPRRSKLDGDGLTLVSLKLDGEPLAADRYAATPDGLTIPQPPNRPFTLEIETLVDPSANTQLSGLYRSSGAYCTQCEAEGFRRITYFPDRPDVMAVYTTRIEADKAEAPVLLANGNLTEHGDLPGRTAFRGMARPVAEAVLSVRAGRRQARRASRTPSPPCPAARSRCASTSSPARRSCCGFAMDSLKRSMRWDEQAFGREYDLDIFMIVAVSRLQHGRDGEQGPQRLQRQIRARLARHRDRPGLRQHRSDHRARVLPQLDRQPHHLPRLVPALPEGRPHRLPRPGVHLRRALARGGADRRRARACAPCSSPRTPGRSPIRCGRSSIARSTTSTPRPSTTRAPRWCG